MCKEYTAAPPLGELLGVLPDNAWFGPVHEVQDKVHGSFISVSVPSRCSPGTLAWVNIENKGKRFAKLDRKYAGFID